MPTVDYDKYEAAQELGVKPATVLKYISRGLIKARFRGCMLINAEELDRFKRERRPVGKPRKKRN